MSLHVQPLVAGLAFLVASLLASPAIAQEGACENLTGTPGTFHLTLESSGMERTYLLDVPDSYDATRPTPVVFNFHGYTSSALQQAYISNMPEKGTAGGFIVVHPQGYMRSWNAGTCCGAALRDDIDDVGFVLDMIAEISERYCVDPHRIHSTGLSNGGYLSHRLACEIPDVIASVAPVAGLIGIPCQPSRSVAIHQTHGTEDNLVPYEQGVEDIQWWAENNGCIGTPQVTYTHLRTTCVRYPACDDEADVELCTMEGGGHWWYDYATYTTTDDVLDFFIDHPLR